MRTYLFALSGQSHDSNLKTLVEKSTRRCGSKCLMKSRVRKLYPILVYLLQVLFTFEQSLAAQESRVVVNLQKEKPTSVQSSFADLFQLVKEVQLDTSGGNYIGMISDVALTSEGHIIVTDHSIARQAFMFSSSGSFIGRIGGVGRGPGEYQNPAFVRLDKDGNIYITDIGSDKLLVYTANREYKNSFQLKKNPNRVAVNSKGIYFQLFDFSEKSTLFHFSPEGKLLNSFSPIDEKFKPLLLFLYAGGGLVSDKDDNLYQLTVAKYEITKFSHSGTVLAKFRRDAAFLREHTASLPDLRDRKAWQKLSYERTLIHNMFYLDPGFLLVQCINHDEKRNPDFVMEIFDLDGNLKAGEIHLPNMVVASAEDFICFVEQPPSNGSKQVPNPKLQFYRLK